MNISLNITLESKMDLLQTKVNIFNNAQGNVLDIILELTEIGELIDTLTIERQWNSVPEFKDAIHGFISNNYSNLVSNEQLELFFVENKHKHPSRTEVYLFEFITKIYEQQNSEEAKNNLISYSKNYIDFRNILNKQLKVLYEQFQTKWKSCCKDIKELKKQFYAKLEDIESDTELVEMTEKIEEYKGEISKRVTSNIEEYLREFKLTHIINPTDSISVKLLKDELHKRYLEVYQTILDEFIQSLEVSNEDKERIKKICLNSDCTEAYLSLSISLDNLINTLKQF